MSKIFISALSGLAFLAPMQMPPAHLVQARHGGHSELLAQNPSQADPRPWYSQGIFHPDRRVEIIVTNPLDRARKDVPVTVPRSQMPMLFADVHELEVTLVDPDGEPRGEPSRERLARYGYHEIRAESHGRMIFHQLDDLDKDGLWDELFFMVDLEAGESKTLHLYHGHNDRGWNPHASTAGIGNYSRHLVPFWESEYVGWKLWYSTDVDVYAKRVPQLMSQRMIGENLDGYAVDPDMGSDIMAVGQTLGGGGILLYEDPDDPHTVSRPRFTPAREQAGKSAAFNAGQLSDTRYSYDVIVNGPLRSMVRVNTFNWNTGNGSYELQQTYTAFARHNTARVDVRFTRFEPDPGLRPVVAVGIRRHQEEEVFRQEETMVLSAGREEIVNPDDVDRIQKLFVDFTAHALHVPSAYRPRFRRTDAFSGNYTFMVEPDGDRSFSYYIGSAWSEGPPFDSIEAFHAYVANLAEATEHPLAIQVGLEERRS